MLDTARDSKTLALQERHEPGGLGDQPRDGEHLYAEQTGCLRALQSQIPGTSTGRDATRLSARSGVKGYPATPRENSSTQIKQSSRTSQQPGVESPRLLDRPLSVPPGTGSRPSDDPRI